jgi:putative methyltransferase (TIGR04325 family)
MRILYQSRTRSWVERVEAIVPPLRVWHRHAYDEHFFRLASWERLFRGVYPTWRAAEEAIPEGRRVGYDHEETSSFLGFKGAVHPFDYPMLFWLAKLLTQRRRVFDFGGYTGISYYSYEKYLSDGPDLQWRVYDLPAIVKQGRRIAVEQGRTALRFTTEPGDADGADIFMAAGSLQFEPVEIADRLRVLNQPPRHLLINKLPAVEGEEFFTLHNMGQALSPYRIYSRPALVRSLEAIGYRLVDSWRNADLGCYIPFHPEKTVREYAGLYFARE